MINTPCRYTNSSSHNPELKTFIAGDRHQNASSLGTKSAGPVIRSLTIPRPWNIRTRCTPNHERCNRTNGYGSLDRCERDVTFKLQFLYWINQSILARISALTEIVFYLCGESPWSEAAKPVRWSSLLYLSWQHLDAFICLIFYARYHLMFHSTVNCSILSSYRSRAIWIFIVNAHMYALCAKTCNHRSTPPISYISFMQFFF